MEHPVGLCLTRPGSVLWCSLAQAEVFQCPHVSSDRSECGFVPWRLWSWNPLGLWGWATRYGTTRSRYCTPRWPLRFQYGLMGLPYWQILLDCLGATGGECCLILWLGGPELFGGAAVRWKTGSIATICWCVHFNSGKKASYIMLHLSIPCSNLLYLMRSNNIKHPSEPWFSSLVWFSLMV